jgi:tRNA(Ile)-lysidine synthase
MSSTRHKFSAQPVQNPAIKSIEAKEFAALMKRFGAFLQSPRIAVAVSGGSDSMALALCAQRWLDENFEGGSVLALIVDHGLRKESAAEATQTERSLAKFGIDAEILNWQHEPVTARLHQAARQARYELMINACKRHGISDLFFAHHREDQAETILMRFAKGSGVAGLAGMPAQSTIDGVRILRPFLGTAKERLAATCNAAGLPFVIDSSNASSKYARGRLRRVLPLLAAEGFTIERLVDLGMRATEAQDVLDHAAYALVRVASSRDAGGAIKLDLEQLRSAPRGTAMQALTICIEAIHHEDYPPERASLLRVFDAVCEDGAMAACTLNGALIAKNHQYVSFMREAAAIKGDVSIEPGTSFLWDQRWRVTLPAHAQSGLVIRPLGNPPGEVVDRLAPGLRDQIPQGRVRASYPALWFKEALALIPALPATQRQVESVAELALGWPPIAGRPSDLDQ